MYFKLKQIFEKNFLHMDEQTDDESKNVIRKALLLNSDI